MTTRTIPTAECEKCRRDEAERAVLSGPRRNHDAIAQHYTECDARSYFATAALVALATAGAPSDLIRRVEEFRTYIGNTGD